MQLGDDFKFRATEQDQRGWEILIKMISYKVPFYHPKTVLLEIGKCGEPVSENR